MRVTIDSQNFKIALIPGNIALGAELISYVRRVLSLIQEVRQYDIFETSEHAFDGTSTG